MSQVTDAKHTALIAQGHGGAGKQNTSDMYYDWLGTQVTSEGGTPLGNTSDRKLQLVYLLNSVTTGQYQDLWVLYLDGFAPASVGRNYSDLIFWFWATDGGHIPPIVSITVDSTAITSDDTTTTADHS